MPVPIISVIQSDNLTNDASFDSEVLSLQNDYQLTELVEPFGSTNGTQKIPATHECSVTHPLEDLSNKPCTRTRSHSKLAATVQNDTSVTKEEVLDEPQVKEIAKSTRRPSSSKALKKDKKTPVNRKLKEGAQRSVNAQERATKKPTTTLPIDQSFMQRQLSIISSTDIIKSARKVLEKKCDLESKSGIANRSEMKICAEATEDTDHKTLNVGLKLLKANPEKLYMDVEEKNGHKMYSSRLHHWLDASRSHYQHNSEKMSMQDELKEYNQGDTVVLKVSKTLTLRFMMKRGILHVKGDDTAIWKTTEFQAIRQLVKTATRNTSFLNRHASLKDKPNEQSICEPVKKDLTVKVENDQPITNKNEKTLPIQPSNNNRTTVPVVKKRNRLSLKGFRTNQDSNQNEESGKQAAQTEAEDASTDNNDCQTSEGIVELSHIKAENIKSVPCSPISSTALVTAEAPEPEVIPPAIASLRNLGNTCFLNSVLQVLRYTPNFIENMNELAHHAKITLKEKRAMNDKNDYWHEEDIGEIEDTSVLVLLFVKYLSQLFTTMTTREAEYREKSTKYIAIRPYDVLDVIVRLNPMFEGNLQHDAHEVLNCVMCYIQDAVREIRALNKQHTQPSIVSCNGTEHYLCVKKRKHSDETQQSECDAGSQDVTECKRKRISLSSGDDCSDPSMLPFTAYKDGESAENSATSPITTNSACVKLERCTVADLMSKTQHCSSKNITDYVEHVFQGKMCLRTRCLECEHFTQRQEMFQDICLPIKKPAEETDFTCSQDNDDTRDGFETRTGMEELRWLQEGLAEKESLNGDNKYFCDECLHLVEAERSLHYQQLPTTLTLHLKRFAASATGPFGSVTKVNDYVKIPLELPCLRDACKDCDDEQHIYDLYGLISHTGISISSGHYVSYVKVPSNHLSQMKENNTAEGGDHGSHDQHGEGSHDTQGLHSDTEQGTLNEAVHPVAGPNEHLISDPNNNQDDNNNVDTTATNAQHTVSNSTVAEMCDENNMMGDAGEKDKMRGLLEEGTRWLECDDDYIATLTQKEFLKLLSPTGLCTPYILFYQKR